MLTQKIFIYYHIIHNFSSLSRRHRKGDGKRGNHVPHCKTDVSKFSFFPRTDRDWNQLLPDMPRISSLEEFQNYLRSFFIIILFIVACNFYLRTLPSV